MLVVEQLDPSARSWEGWWEPRPGRWAAFSVLMIVHASANTRSVSDGPLIATEKTLGWARCCRKVASTTMMFPPSITRGIIATLTSMIDWCWLIRKHTVLSKSLSEQSLEAQARPLRQVGAAIDFQGAMSCERLNFVRRGGVACRAQRVGSRTRSALRSL